VFRMPQSPFYVAIVQGVVRSQWTPISLRIVNLLYDNDSQ
jgi:hypothetical protein